MTKILKESTNQYCLVDYALHEKKINFTLIINYKKLSYNNKHFN